MNLEKHVATIELYPDRRLVVARQVTGGRGITLLRIEFKGYGGVWRAAGRDIAIPNDAIFMLADAIGRATEMAGGDRK